MPVHDESSGDLGSRLHEVREREGLSVGTVASMLDVSSDTLRAIEAGHPPEGAELERVSAWLDTSIERHPDT